MLKYLLLISVILLSGCGRSDTIPVFILAGQSNMSGDGRVIDLYYQDINPDTRLVSTQPDVKIWWSDFYGSVTKHQWQDYRPGMLSPNQFGPEITFGRKLADISGKKVYLIKVAAGGTSLKRDWLPDGGGIMPMYDIYKEEIARGMQALIDEGLNPKIQGLVWHQGETDAMTLDQAEEYEHNLKEFIANTREIVKDPLLPVFIGELGAIYPASIYPFRSMVVEAQNTVVHSISKTYLIKTDDLGLLVEESRGVETGVHFNSAGYLTLGNRFADYVLSMFL